MLMRYLYQQGNQREQEYLLFKNYATEHYVIIKVHKQFKWWQMRRASTSVARQGVQLSTGYFPPSFLQKHTIGIWLC